MTSRRNGSPSAATLEGNLGNLMHSAQDSLRHSYKDCEAKVRQSPSTAILAAAGVGFLLHHLPIAALLGGAARLVLALLRPAAILFCAAKAYELVQRKAQPRGE